MQKPQSRLKRNFTSSKKRHTAGREVIFLIALYLGIGSIFIRLFYWQIVKGAALEQVADEQYQRTVTHTGQRGSIFTSEGFSLVQNKKVYRVFAHPHLVTDNPQTTAENIAKVLLPELPEYATATSSALQEELLKSLAAEYALKLSKPNTRWINIQSSISENAKVALEKLQLAYIGFDPLYRRDYPEASLAANLVGFVGKDSAGADIGYFGLEGALENELKARENTNNILTDALGVQLSGDTGESTLALNGRNIYTTIRRDVQFLAEQQLKKGVEKYGAKSGEIIIMDPSTGKILGLAVAPSFDPDTFYTFDSSSYKNPSVTSVYEPGSTFKTLTVAAGIDTGVISANTQCPSCAGPRVFGKYTIRTWNDEYHPNITIEEGLAKSDNTAMIFIAEQLGKERFENYLRLFGVGEPLGIELQGDTSTPFPTKLGSVELATTSFGQGIGMTSLQLMRAISAIANHGIMMQPQIVEKVENPSTGELLENPPTEVRRVISQATAAEVTRMMVTAASRGEAQWIASKTHNVAGKTGTSQVAENGTYNPNKTIASFIGFSPPEEARFILLVKLTEPSSSPWAAETAAPLWYDTAEKLFLLLNITPDHQEK
jgi:cell division protein FtsI/penicillin-binding protein 2